jgi:putative NADH-flavin reductase
MKIVLIGATGFVGSFILTEALKRHHIVEAFERNPKKLTKHHNMIPIKGDIFKTDDLAELIAAHDAVISAYNPGWSEPDIYNKQVKGTRCIIDAAKIAGVRRLLMVGGAGSLEVSPGVQLVDTPDFPQQFKQGALATREALNMLKLEHELLWTFLSPSAKLEPGERTGNYRMGTDQLIVDENGVSKISTQDYAKAMIDELENPQHMKMRFTVGY